MKPTAIEWLQSHWQALLLGTADMKRAVALMRQIDDSLGIDADV